jgi:signal transduction histidine kinase
MLAWLAPYQLRLVFRGAFSVLALATVAMALYVLWQEKELSYHNYQYSFRKTAAEITARLHHPAGQLALLNPPHAGVPVVPLHPLLLPFSAIDFDDRDKVRQAVEMSGCQVQYKAGTVCVAVGNNPWAGGFIYVAGSFASTALVAHAHGRDEILSAHHVLLSVNLRGQTYRWVAPFEAMGNASNGMHGRLTGFVDNGDYSSPRRPVKDFRGWVWQSPVCLNPGSNPQGCLKSAFFSVRLPIGLLRDNLFQPDNPQWPPADLEHIQVHVQVMPPNGDKALIDSDSSDALPPFALADLAPLLLPGETLHIRQMGPNHSGDLVAVSGGELPRNYSHWLNIMIRHLPVEGYDKPIEHQEIIATPLGYYELTLVGDVGSVNQSLSAVASRVSWFVGVILLALLLTWFVIEIGIIRRITELTRRAASVSQTVKGAGGFEGFDLSDLRGPDELGVLARCLADLLQRVKEDVERERIRAEQEKDMWHAVGHEIMSPLQSLMALHSSGDDDSSRYINRMQQAVRILYGNASPSEAFQASTLQIRAVDVDEFLRHVASNAPCVDIENVSFQSDCGSVLVRADEYSLEDVVTHVLRNADRFRVAGSVISIILSATETTATVSIHNIGPHIPDNLIERIFEYGVSDQPDAGANGNRGQGLFVAKTYMAKMGGTISAQNVEDGVSFVLSLQRAPAAAQAGAIL